MPVKLVIFDLGGVVITTPYYRIQEYLWELGLPGEFVQKLFVNKDLSHPFSKAETGKFSSSQFFPEFDEHCKKVAKEEGVELSAAFSSRDMFDRFMSGMKVVPEMVNASTALRKHGIKTCILTNDFLIDHVNRSAVSVKATELVAIRHHFDELFQSCQLQLHKPDPEIYKLVCSKMGVDPSEAVFLDDLAVNLKPAKEMGITTILVKNPFSALRTLKDVTGVDVLEPHCTLPCTPDSVPHCFVNLKTGIRMHYVELGTGPAIILLHGWPEFWYSWKYQIPALADAGYRVIAPDQRGLGQTSCPQELEAYGHDKFAADIVSLMDALYIPQAILVGHDWGGTIAWNLCLRYPERVSAVASMTPFFPPNPDINPLKALKANPNQFQYQIYFQQEGPPEAEFEKDIRRFFKFVLRSGKDEDRIPGITDNFTSTVLERGGLMAGSPENISRSSMITEEDLDYFVATFSKTGFRSGLNWYRNKEKDWRWSCQAAGRKIQQPSLLITVGKDPVIRPELSKPMEKWVCNLKTVHIEESAHWTPLECPLKLNNILVDWLKGLPTTSSAKL